MVNPGVNLSLFNFQEEASLKLIDKTRLNNNKKIVMKSPTGSGKTIILIDYVEKYLNNVNPNTAFVWLTPGNGNLEEQSKEKMEKFAKGLKTQDLFEALLNGFEASSTTFINWELITSRKNTSLRDGERKNLYDRIHETKRAGIDFIIIIDEEHLNDTNKANSIVDYFSPKKIIRVSATAHKSKLDDFFEIDEIDVINSGLITKAINVNEGIIENIQIDNDYDILLDLADKKRKEISNKYIELNKNIRPLVLIQFPNASPSTIKAVEYKLEELGYTYDNNMVAKWMSDEKINIDDNFTKLNGTPVFLLMKQAINAGWDCPRAKILVKLRENTSEEFAIQTIGRIRRMPEVKHYEDSVLDLCYVYTFDEKYKEGLLKNANNSHLVKRVFLKDKCKTFTLKKQLKDLDFDGLGEREVYKKVYDYYIDRYNLSNNKSNNKTIFESKGYIFENEILGKALHGEFITSQNLLESETFYTTRKKVNTHKHGIELLHAVDEIKKSIGMTQAKVKTILERLFRKSSNNGKLLNLETDEFYAFIINNKDLIKHIFREVTAQMAVQENFLMKPKILDFKIPEQELYRFDIDVKDNVEILSNAYKDYTSGFCTNVVRSQSESLFEKYIESCDEIDWIYKNGDTGQQYFSIVYLTALRKQYSFYPDYIVKKKDGSIWIIETKGGEKGNKDNNIDLQIENKFNAFKQYANEHKLNWAFVRDKNFELYYNNTEFSHSMNSDEWKSIKNIIK